MEQANADEVKKVKCKNTIHLAACLMAQRGLRRRSSIMLRALKPLSSAHAKEVKAAADSSMHVTALQEMDFDLFGKGGWYRSRASAGTKAGASTAVRDPVCKLELHADDEDEELYALVLYKLVVSRVKYKATCMSLWAHMPPQQLILLLHPMAKVRNDSLSNLKESWDCLLGLEQKQFQHAAVGAALNDIPWVANGVVRTSLAQLAAHGPNTTVPLQMSRAKRLYQPLADKVLDLYHLNPIDVEEPDATPTSAHPPQTMSAEFDASRRKVPFHENKLKALVQNKGSHALPNAQRNMTLTGAWLMLRELRASSRLDRIEDMWHCLLFCEDSIVHDRTCEAATQHAVLVWPACAVVSSVGMTVSPSLERSAAKSEWLTVVDLDHWTHWPTRTTAPRVTKHVLALPSTPVGVVARQVAPPETLWQAAAKEGFPNLTSKFMDLALDRLEVQIPKGTKHQLKLLDKKRSGCWEGHRPCKLVSEENLEHAMNAFIKLDVADNKEAKTFQKDYTSACTKKSTTLMWLKNKKYIDDATVELKLQQEGIKMRAVADTAPKAKSSKTEWLSEEKWLKAHIPQVKGATIGEVVNDKSSLYTARYAAAPVGYQKSFSRSFGGGGSRSKDDAAKQAFTWIWEIHEVVTGEKCPHMVAS
eukprot:6491249-Amphidinium_carterae.2